MSHFIQILIFLPVVGAIIGYVTKWVAIRMLWWPATWRGIGPIGWQGVIQRRSSKFAEGVADTVGGTGISVQSLLERVAPEGLATALASDLEEAAPDLARRAIDALSPGLFDTMAPPAQQMVIQQVQHESRRIATETISAVKRVMNEVIDLRRLIITRLSGADADRLARLFRRVGRRELEVVIWYGAVLGFIIGFLEVFGYTWFEKWWILPLVGAIDGLINNWLAIQMIFRPYERKVYLGFFPFQGLFPARQEEIAREYGEMLAAEVLGPGEILDSLDAVATTKLTLAAQQAIETSAEPLLPLLGMLTGQTIGRDERTRILGAVSSALEERLPAVRPRVEAYLRERLDVAGTLDQELARLPKAEFERVLRGVFEADEWILVSLGGVLGGLIGLVQAAIVVTLM